MALRQGEGWTSAFVGVGGKRDQVKMKNLVSVKGVFHLYLELTQIFTFPTFFLKKPSVFFKKLNAIKYYRDN